jgi:hypothetical protein
MFDKGAKIQSLHLGGGANFSRLKIVSESATTQGKVNDGAVEANRRCVLARHRD